MDFLKGAGTLIIASLVFGWLPAWCLWTATILKALIREHKKVPQAIIDTMWPNPYKQRGVGHALVNSTINGFLAVSYTFAAIVLGALAFGIISDVRHGFPILGDFVTSIPFLVTWLLPSFLLKMKINKMEPATTEWVDSWRI